MPPKFLRDIQPTVLKSESQPSSLHLRGYHTLWRLFPEDFDFIG